MKLILASRSPRRRLLLRQAGYQLRVRPSTVVEDQARTRRPADLVQRLALEKAEDVASRTRSGIVVGADTIVVYGDRILGKPKSRKDAARMLRLLSGRTHTVYTGVALVDAQSRRREVFYERTRVTFRRITQSEIAAYVRSGSPMDKAGAYGIQDDFGAVFVEKVSGCFYTVVGFPLSRFYSVLRAFSAGGTGSGKGKK